MHGVQLVKGNRWVNADLRVACDGKLRFHNIVCCVSFVFFVLLRASSFEDACRSADRRRCKYPFRSQLSLIELERMSPIYPCMSLTVSSRLGGKCRNHSLVRCCRGETACHRLVDLLRK